MNFTPTLAYFIAIIFVHLNPGSGNKDTTYDINKESMRLKVVSNTFIGLTIKLNNFTSLKTTHTYFFKLVINILCTFYIQI